MKTRSGSIFGAARLAGLALFLWLAADGSGYAQGVAPFKRLAGQWSGKGTIELSDGSHEAVRCRAAYDVPDLKNNLQLSIRCASESYSFELLGSANYSAGAITGTWSEATRNIAGTISGKASGDHFQVKAASPSYTFSLTLTTHSNRQSVVIQPEYANSAVKRAAFTLERGS
jgi:hypothetical protein